MEAYRILVPRPVQKQLDRLPRSARKRVLAKIVQLKQDPRPRGCVKLRGYEAEYRIRIGEYRLRYEVRDAERTVVLLHCLARKDAYR